MKWRLVAEPVVDLVLIPRLKMHDKVDDLVGLHRADAEHVPRVDETDAADLHEIPDQLRRGADERVRRGAA